MPRRKLHVCALTTRVAASSTWDQHRIANRITSLGVVAHRPPALIVTAGTTLGVGDLFGLVARRAQHHLRQTVAA